MRACAVYLVKTAAGIIGERQAAGYYWWLFTKWLRTVELR